MRPVRSILGILAVLAVLTTTACDARVDARPDPPGDGRALAAPADPAPAGSAATLRDFAGGGPAPRFDSQVDVSVDDRLVLTLTRDEARDRAAWTLRARSLLHAVLAGRLRPPPSCRALPSPTGPVVRHHVDVRGEAVLWRPHGCGFAVRMLVDRRGGIAAVALDR